MANGFQQWSENGTLQIDDSAPVLSFRQKGTATLTQTHPASQTTGAPIAKYVDLTFSGLEAPSLAIAGPSAYGVIACTRSGSTWTFRVIGIQNMTIGNPPFTWYLFDRPLPTASGAGAEGYSANGQIFFSSFYPPIITSAFIGNGLSDAGDGVGLPSNRNYAAIFSARILLQEYSEHFTNQQVVTYWSYNLNVASCEVSPNIYDPSVKRCGWGDLVIQQGTNEGGQSPSYPAGDLAGWGAASVVQIVDVTDL